MKTATVLIAILSLITLAACTSEEPSTDAALDASLGQALTPGGQVDCAAINSALTQNGIDPAQLSPDVVFEACVASGQVDDQTCDAVANGCFGHNANCNNPATTPPNQPQPGDICDQVFAYVDAQNVDPTSITPDEAFAACVDQGHDPGLCQQVATCFDPAGNPPGNTNPNVPPGSDFCEMIYQSAAGQNIDPNGVSRDEAYQMCIDQNYDAQLCATVADQCFADPSSGGPNSPAPGTLDCAQIEQLLADQGYQTPIDPSQADELREACLQSFNDDVLCEQVVQCAL